MRLPVRQALGAGFAYLFTHWGVLLKALWLPALLLLAANIYIMPSYLEKSLAVAAMEEGADPAAIFSAVGALFAASAPLYLAIAVFWPMMIAASLRHLVRGETQRLPFYLRFGMDEVWILLAAIILSAMFMLAYFVGALSLGVLTGAAVFGGAGAAALVLTFGALAIVVAFVWFSLRMSLTMPATVAARRIGVALSFAATKGAVWSLSLFYLAWGVVLAALAAAYFAVAMPDYYGLLAEIFKTASSDREAAAALERRLMEEQLKMFDPAGPRFFVFAVSTYIYTLLAAAVVSVATGVAYRYLSPAR